MNFWPVRKPGWTYSWFQELWIISNTSRVCPVHPLQSSSRQSLLFRIHPVLIRGYLGSDCCSNSQFLVFSSWSKQLSGKQTICIFNEIQLNICLIVNALGEFSGTAPLNHLSWQTGNLGMIFWAPNPHQSPAPLPLLFRNQLLCLGLPAWFFSQQSFTVLDFEQFLGKDHSQEKLPLNPWMAATSCFTRGLCWGWKPGWLLLDPGRRILWL